MTRNGKQNIGQMVLTLIMIAAALIMIIPLVWMISTSFKTQPEVFAYPVKWLPERPTWEAHRKVWLGALNFVKYYRNLKDSRLVYWPLPRFHAAMDLPVFNFGRTSRTLSTTDDGSSQILFVPSSLFDWDGIIIRIGLCSADHVHHHWRVLHEALLTLPKNSPRPRHRRQGTHHVS